MLLHLNCQCGECDQTLSVQTDFKSILELFMDDRSVMLSREDVERLRDTLEKWLKES